MLNQTAHDRAFLGQGIQFPIFPDAYGRLNWSKGAAAIEQSIWNILATRRGERVMRPDFGCGIHELVFSVNSELAHGEIGSEVQTALVRWEPRVDVLEIEVRAGEGQPNVMLIHLDYRIRATNTIHNLVYPFFVTEGRV